MAETIWENKVTIFIDTNQYHLVVFLNRLQKTLDTTMTIRILLLISGFRDLLI